MRQEASTQVDTVNRLSIPAARRVVVDTGKPANRKESKQSVESKKTPADARNGGQDNKLPNGISRKVDNPKAEDSKPTAEVVGKKTTQTQTQSARTGSEIPPTPMAPRGPAPRVVVSTGKPVKVADKPVAAKAGGQQQQARDERGIKEKQQPAVKGSALKATREKDAETSAGVKRSDDELKLPLNQLEEPRANGSSAAAIAKTRQRNDKTKEKPDTVVDQQVDAPVEVRLFVVNSVSM